MSTEVHAGWTQPLPTKRGRPPGTRIRRDHSATAAAIPAPDTPEGDPLAGLSPSLRAVARLVAEGRTNAEVGALLGISELTIKNHMCTVYRKLGLEVTPGVGSKRLAYLVGYWDGQQAAKGGSP